MDNNFDERLTKLENVLSGIERFMSEFKRHMDGNSLKDDIATESNEETNITADKSSPIDKDTEDESRGNEITENTKDNKQKYDKEYQVDQDTNGSADKKSTEATENAESVVENVPSIENVNTKIDKDDKSVEYNEQNSIADAMVNALASGNRDIKKHIDSSKDVDDLGRDNAIDSVSVRDNIDYRELNRRLISIEGLLKEISISIKGLKPRGCYRNWEAQHEVILGCLFVPKGVFNSVLWRMSRQMENYYTGEASVNRLFDTMPTFQVSRTCRFPPNGVYINLNDYDVYNFSQRVREAAHFRASRDVGATVEVFKVNLAHLHNLAERDLGDPSAAGIMYDLSTFESSYGLEWIEEGDIDDK